MPVGSPGSGSVGSGLVGGGFVGGGSLSGAPTGAAGSVYITARSLATKEFSTMAPSVRVESANRDSKGSASNLRRRGGGASLKFLDDFDRGIRKCWISDENPRCMDRSPCEAPWLRRLEQAALASRKTGHRKPRLFSALGQEGFRERAREELRGGKISTRSTVAIQICNDNVAGTLRPVARSRPSTGRNSHAGNGEREIGRGLKIERGRKERRRCPVQESLVLG